MTRILAIVIFALFSTASFAESFKDIISYLASDKLEGRKPGQSGNEMATQYLVNKLQAYGLEALDGSYKQEFTIFTEMLKDGDNEFQFGSLATSFQPISYSLSGDLNETSVVFAGFGISIPKSDPNLKYDDYAGIDVTNKIVVVLTGDPGIGNVNSKFRHPDYINYRSLFYKLKNAISHGAKGILVVNDPMSIVGYPQEEAPYFNSAEGGGSRFSIISGKITNSFINTKMPKGLDTLSVQKEIAKTQKPKSFTLAGSASLKVHLKKKTGRIANIVGVLKGTDQKLMQEVVVIGGHMDHLGWGGESSLDASRDPKIHNGADDNASGTAMVLKLAKELSGKQLKRTYVFVLFNAEEMGLLGSSHFVDMWQRYEATYGKITAMLNFDMVGRYNKELSIMGTDSATGWSTHLGPLTSNLSMAFKKNSVGSSDHASFINKKIPSLFFTTGAHEDYHTSHDTFEKIDYKALGGIQKYALGLISNLDAGKSLVYNPNYDAGDGGEGRSRGYGAHLGCVPEFGQADDIVGVVCTKTSDSSPAMQAGMTGGDILVQIGDIDIKNVYDLAFALKYYRAGDKVEIAWKRGETLMKQIIVLAKSRRS